MPACTGPKHAHVLHWYELKSLQSPMHPNVPCLNPSLALSSRTLPMAMQHDSHTGAMMILSLKDADGRGGG